MSAQQTNLGIVVGVDGSPCSHTAVEWAARDAQMRNVALRVVQVVPPVITAPEGWAFEYSRFQEAQKREIVEHSYLVAQAHQIVEQAHKVALEASSSGRAAQITGEVLHGQIVPTLANISRQVAMVVLGYRGQGAVAGALLGSVSSSLVRHAHGPVAVIPEEPRPARPPHAPVVVGIDGSPTSGLAAEIAFDEASRRGVDLVALHAWSDMGPLDFPRLNWAPIEWRNLEDEQEKMLARRLSGWQDRYPDVVVQQSRGVRSTGTPPARIGTNRSACGGWQPRPRGVPRHASRLSQQSGGQFRSGSGYRRPNPPRSGSAGLRACAICSGGAHPRGKPRPNRDWATSGRASSAGP